MMINYLSFALKRISNHEGNVVIFGHSLGTTYRHLNEAIQDWHPETHKRAMSIYTQNPVKIMKYKLQMRKNLPELAQNIVYFDAMTHPLGKPDLYHCHSEPLSCHSERSEESLAPFHTKGAITL